MNDIINKAKFSLDKIKKTIQTELDEWQLKNFGKATQEQLALGVCEEAGELAHVILKRSQGIRGYDNDEKFLEEAGDAIADTMIYLAQLASNLDLDLLTLYNCTAKEVMKRNWKKYPIDGLTE